MKALRKPPKWTTNAFLKLAKLFIAAIEWFPKNIFNLT